MSDLQARICAARQNVAPRTDPQLTESLLVARSKMATDAKSRKQAERALEVRYGIRDPLTGRTSQRPVYASSRYRDAAKCQCGAILRHELARCEQCGAEPVRSTRGTHIL